MSDLAVNSRVQNFYAGQVADNADLNEVDNESQIEINNENVSVTSEESDANEVNQVREDARLGALGFFKELGKFLLKPLRMLSRLPFITYKVVSNAVQGRDVRLGTAFRKAFGIPTSFSDARTTAENLGYEVEDNTPIWGCVKVSKEQDNGTVKSRTLPKLLFMAHFSKYEVFIPLVNDGFLPRYSVGSFITAASDDQGISKAAGDNDTDPKVPKEKIEVLDDDEIEYE